MKLQFIALAFFILSQFNTYAQVEFQRSFGSEKKEQLNHIIPTQDKGFITIGTTESFGAGKQDIYVVKTDSLGSLDWSKTIGGKGSDYGIYIDKAADGNYFILAHSTSFGTQYTDLLLIKMHTNGNIMWSINYGLENSEFANHLSTTPDGGCVILGQTITYLGKGKNADLLVLKVKENGIIEWSKKYGGKDLDYGYSIEPTKDGGYIIAGETKTFTSGDIDAYLVKLTPDGTTEWAKGLGGVNADYGKYAAETSDGGFLLAGSTTNFNSRDVDILITKVAKNGSVLWSKIYGGNMQEHVSSLRVLKNDNFVVCGYTNSFDLVNENSFVEVFSANGQAKWGKAYGSDSSEVATSMSLVDDKFVIVCGSTKGFGVKGEDGYVLKTMVSRTIDDCNATDVTTLVKKSVEIKETAGGGESMVKIKPSNVRIESKPCLSEEKILCSPEEED